ncbi:MAG: peptidylprolyl isomerase [Erythrobacter sp.]
MKFTLLPSLRSAIISAGLTACAIATLPAAAQTIARPTSDNPLGIPQNITIFDVDNPDQRGATALVNGYVITGTDINQRVALVTSASQTEVTPEEMRRLRLQVLSNVIDETLKIQAAAAQEIPAQRAQVEQTYTQLAAQNFGQEPQKMDEYLITIGSSSNALKRQIEGELAWENLVRRNITPFVNVSDEEVQERLKRLEEDKGKEEFRIGEIYLSATSENREAVSNNARQILEQLQAGGSFVAYARQFSEASTAVVGGDLGFVRLGQLPPQLAQVAQTLQTGQLAGPIEIPGGFSILYLIDKRQVLVANPRDAVLSLMQISIDFPADVDQAAAETKFAEFATYVQGLQSCAAAEGAREAIGANVVSNQQIQARQLPEQLQNLILSLQVGQSTPPFGSPQEGIRVFMLCGRDDPEDAALPSSDQIRRELEEKQIAQRAQRYLRDLRNDAYIEYN